MGGANGSRERAPDDRLRDIHQRRCVWRWVSLRSTHPTTEPLRHVFVISRRLAGRWWRRVLLSSQCKNRRSAWCRALATRMH